MKRLALCGATAALLAMHIGLAWAGGGADDEAATEDARTAPARTVKERLSSKASDEQRVDNCKVPLELRGPKPRPDDCGEGPASSRSPQ